jgi:hypothetical protein
MNLKSEIFLIYRTGVSILEEYECNFLDMSATYLGSKMISVRIVVCDFYLKFNRIILTKQITFYYLIWMK